MTQIDEAIVPGDIYNDIYDAALTIKAPDRISVSEFSSSIHIDIPGGYCGPYDSSLTPYFKEPMDALSDRTHNTVCFVGSAQTGKALALDTPLPTPDGWTTMGEVQGGDWLLNEKGEPTQVLASTEVLHNRPCYRIQFSDHSEIVCDENHLWSVKRSESHCDEVVTAKKLLELKHAIVSPDAKSRRIKSIAKVRSVPVRCVQVDNPSHLFLAGRSMIPTHNSQAIFSNFILHSIVCDPHDILAVQTTETIAKDYSDRVLSRLIEQNPEVKSRIKKTNGNMTYTKRTKSGAVISMAWPTPSMFAGRTLRTVLITDLDRKHSIKEGSLYLLALNRIRAAMSRGLVVAESTPSIDLAQQDSFTAEGHEGPPVEGIFSIYNTGDMRRWYMPCPECGEMFLPGPGPEGFWVPEQTKAITNEIRARQVNLICTANGCGIHSDHKRAMVKDGAWVKNAQRDDPEAEVPSNNIASFWLPGHAAAFQTWEEMILKYLNAREILRDTGKSADLKVSVNTDFGCAFQLPREASKYDDPASLKDREEPIARGVCPDWTQCITSTVDIQKNRFVVQVIAWGQFAESQIIDRYSLRYSERMNSETGDRHEMQPRTYLEDWDVLKKEVILKSYSTLDEEYEFLPVLVGCDAMGGLETTINIAQFYQKLRKEGLHTKFLPVRGDGRLARRLVTTSTLSEKQLKEKHIQVRDVPLLIINVNKLKDEFFVNLAREEPGPNYVHFGDWTPNWLYSELVSESRGSDGVYTLKKQKTNNEALDLYIYARAILEKKGYFRINWESPPYWCTPRKGPGKKSEDNKQVVNPRIDTGRFNRRSRR